MNLRHAIVFVSAAVGAFAAEPRTVAEAAMKAWVAHDAKALAPVCDPELVQKMRRARAVEFYLERYPEKAGIAKEGSDAEVVALLCDALASVVPPRDGRFVYEDRYLDTQVTGDLAVVRFESTVASAGKASNPLRSTTEIVLKKRDGRWLFLWSPAVRIHVDLAWDPRPS